MRVGAIDCGTNSIRLLVADVDGTHLDEVVREMTVVRLGEGVDRSGAFSEAALERTFAACDAYAATLRDVGVERLRFVATSASRDVSNRAAFVDGVRARLGVEPEVISGAEEARLSFRGAVEGLPPERIAMPTLVVDIGGGSTEFVLGDRGADGRIDVEAAISVDIGCVRMTERHLHGDPPRPEEIARVAASISMMLPERMPRAGWWPMPTTRRPWPSTRATKHTTLFVPMSSAAMTPFLAFATMSPVLRVHFGVH